MHLLTSPPLLKPGAGTMMVALLVHACFIQITMHISNQKSKKRLRFLRNARIQNDLDFCVLCLDYFLGLVWMIMYPSQPKYVRSSVFWRTARWWSESDGHTTQLCRAATVFSQWIARCASFSNKAVVKINKTKSILQHCSWFAGLTVFDWVQVSVHACPSQLWC